MSRIGALDTNSAALRARLDSHARYGSADMTGWALELLGAHPGERVLDVGAGTGAQSVQLAQSGCEVTAVDTSAESLAALREAAPGVKTIEGRFDELAGRECDAGPFDRAISSYALYYAEDERLVVGRIRALLRDGGTFVFVGPSRDNNAELRALHHEVAGTQPPPLTPAARFMEEAGPALCEDLFASVERFTFENPLDFDSGDAVLDYWRNYNLYDAALEERFAGRVRAQGAFRTVKRVVGIRAVK